MLYTLKTLFVSLVSLGLLGLMLAAFWFQDWQYSLPTPRPVHLAQPQAGHTLSLADFPGLRPSPDGKPLFLHFFNPDCPCSRFNLDHVRRLVRDHGASVRFVAVVESAAPVRSAVLGGSLPMPVVLDPGGAIARACGVYSTPQAVLLDSRGKLYYRGNYNVSRYCTDRSTEFARVALEALLATRTPAPLPPAALSRSAATAYGCQLPSNPALPTAAGAEFTRFCRQRFSTRKGPQQ